MKPGSVIREQPSPPTQMPTARGSAANPAITSDIGWGYTELECWINFADYLD
jgi:hypothetical protein